jgi:hypothetical protein
VNNSYDDRQRAKHDSAEAEEDEGSTHMFLAHGFGRPFRPFRPSRTPTSLEPTDGTAASNPR